MDAHDVQETVTGWEKTAAAFGAGEAASARDVSSRRLDDGRYVFEWDDWVFAVLDPTTSVVTTVEGIHDSNARALREIVWWQAERAGRTVVMDNAALEAIRAQGR